MAAPADLSRLRINRDAPSAPERKALARNLALFAAALAIVAVVAVTLRSRAVPVVQVATVSADGAGRGAAGGGGVTTSVTANGYVVARTKASVAAKVPGRLA